MYYLLDKKSIFSNNFLVDPIFQNIHGKVNALTNRENQAKCPFFAGLQNFGLSCKKPKKMISE